MSLIQSPPRERMAIETIVARNSDDVVRKAILRELNREGQVFYLHNRVMTIEKIHERLRRVVPEARSAVAHGQMPAGRLAQIMHRFVSGEFDVLVCTTIIESGVDIPRANTILIDRADRFGIADLYQLRGRVGRSSHKGYAYLLLPSKGPVDADARRRIEAVKKYSHLSAGFRLALRDLEIRGAGNILGPQQSGHIAAVGFGLYCQLLRRSIARLQGKEEGTLVDVELRLEFLTLSPVGPDPTAVAALPYGYIEEEGQRVAIYNRLAECGSTDGLAALSAELEDRYGKLPGPAVRLLLAAELRIRAAGRRVDLVEVRDGKVRLRRAGDYVMENRRFPRLQTVTADEKLAELIERVEAIDAWGG
jgi:transcription-repair coupling factor (superfamily II helicase)